MFHYWFCLYFCASAQFLLQCEEKCSICVILCFLFVFGVPVDSSVYSIISRALFCTRMRLRIWVSDFLFYSQSIERTFVYFFHQENENRIFRLSRIEKGNAQMITTNEQFQRKSIYLVDWIIYRNPWVNPIQPMGWVANDVTQPINPWVENQKGTQP
jgi:hypothetical protein